VYKRLQNFKQIRKTTKNQWKENIVDKALRICREDSEIMNIVFNFDLLHEKGVIMAELSDDEEMYDLADDA